MRRFFTSFFVVFFVFVICLCASAANKLRVSGDNTWVAFVNGEKVGEGNDWQKIGVYNFSLKNGGAVIGLYIHDAEPGATGKGGALADIVLDDGRYFGSDKTWKANAGKPIAERKDGWEKMDFDDSKWESATQMDQFGAGIWGFGAATMKANGLQNPDCKAFWVWAGPNDVADDIYLRFTVPGTQLTSVEIAGKLAISWGNIKK